MSRTYYSPPFGGGGGGGASWVRLFFFFLLSLLILNFGVKGYWKIKSYSFQSYFKDVWEICHEKGYNEDYCILVDFSRPSGEDRMAIIDLKTLSVLDTGPCAHGKERETVRGNLFSQIRRGADVRVLELSRLQRKAIPLLSGCVLLLMGWMHQTAMQDEETSSSIVPDTWVLCTISHLISHSPMLRGDASLQALLC